ncbi:MAG: hypothetical protein KJ970_13905, partial [Candidatus Eisenbacteria bacterium]|nr:hypothetical protein [Candidatus Eisenbacteria bacterium]
MSPEENAKVFRIRRPEARDTRLKTEVAWIRNLVENPLLFDLFYPRGEQNTNNYMIQGSERSPYGGEPTCWPSLDGPAPAQIIITDSVTIAGERIGNMVEIFQNYANWKTEDRGLPTIVKTVSEIIANPEYQSFDVVESIKMFIHHAAQDWGTKWVLLGGDTDIVPTRRLGGPNLGDHNRLDPPADIYYSVFTGDWNLNDDAYFWENNNDAAPDSIVHFDSGFPQIWIGRVPCRSALDAQVITEKIQAYLDPPSLPSDYYQSALFVAGPTNSMNPSDSLSSGYTASERILRVLDGSPYNWSDIERLYAMIPSHAEQCDASLIQCYHDLKDSLDYAWQPAISWDTDELKDRLNDGYHFVWHVEHSEREKLGNPTVDGSPYAAGCLDSTANAIWDGLCVNWLNNEWRSIEDFTAEQAYELQNSASEPRYSIIFSSGSLTNEFDMHSVSEKFLLAPNGGAVAYVGKIQSPGGLNYPSKITETTLDNIVGGSPSPSLGEALILSIVENDVDYDLYPILTDNKWAYIMPLLGDPAMEVWTQTPTEIEATINPNQISSLGAQKITVTVRKKNTVIPVANAIVCLKQGDLAYGVKVTNSAGLVSFDGFPVLDTLGIHLSVVTHNHLPLADTLDITTTPAFLAYDHHLLDDSSPGGDGDGILEAGETANVRVIFRNRGDAAASSPSLDLWPTPRILFDLDINEEFRPKTTYIGKYSGNPPATADTFRLPLSWEGLRIEGEPAYSDLTSERLEIWRTSATGQYVVESTSPSASADTVFTGILKTIGSFSSVSMTGEGLDDYYWSADSIWFEFHGDLTPDMLYFTAESPEWVDVTGSGGTMPRSVAPNDTVGRSFEVSLTEKVPDQSTMVFTSTANFNSTKWSHSDFSSLVRAPITDPIMVDWEFGDLVMGCDTSAIVRPMIRNLGGAQAESIMVIFHKTSGNASVLDSIASFSEMKPGSLAVAVDSVVLCADEFEEIVSTTYNLEIRTYPRNVHPCIAAYIDGGGSHGSQIDPPTALSLDSAGRAFILRWDAPEEANRYLIFHVPEEGENEFLGVADSTTRFEVTHINGGRIEPLDESDDLIPYTFMVKACDRLDCGGEATTSSDYAWLPENDEWPKRVPDGINTAPLVL